MLFRLKRQNNYIKQLFIFFEGANIRIFPIPPSFYFRYLLFPWAPGIPLRQRSGGYYQLDFVKPGINPKRTISRKVTRLTPKSRI